MRGLYRPSNLHALQIWHCWKICFFDFLLQCFPPKPLWRIAQSLWKQLASKKSRRIGCARLLLFRNDRKSMVLMLVKFVDLLEKYLELSVFSRQHLVGIKLSDSKKQEHSQFQLRCTDFLQTGALQLTRLVAYSFKFRKRTGSVIISIEVKDFWIGRMGWKKKKRKNRKSHRISFPPWTNLGGTDLQQVSVGIKSFHPAHLNILHQRKITSRHENHGYCWVRGKGLSSLNEGASWLK